jgi:5-methylcytosine-specific restriction endonuclease McrA
VYCSQLCAQDAGWVRYARRCRVDGRDQCYDVIEALRIRLALILGGGYDRLARKLSGSIRRAIIERDRGKCRICGKAGDEIDHISGSSDDLANLQLLCNLCHKKKTTASFIRITKESHPEAWEKAQWLQRRAAAKQPLHLCDSEEWESPERSSEETARVYQRARDVLSLLLKGA